MSNSNATADPIKLKKKFPTMSLSDIHQFIDQFNSLDLNKDGTLNENEANKSCQTLLKVSYDEARYAIKGLDTGTNKALDLEDYLQLVQNLKSNSYSSNQSTSNKFKKKVIMVKGSTDNTSHTINDDERSEFVTHINIALAHDVHLNDRLPINPETMQIFDECKDGLILSKLINYSSPDTIDERVLNLGKKLNLFKMTENNNLLINSAKAIGCSVVNIGSKDLIDGKEHLIMGLIWQIIKIGLLAKIDIKYHPELYRLLLEDETLEEFLKLAPEMILLRWFNYHLKNADWERKVTNFGGDLKDGCNYIVLLNQLRPDKCSMDALKESNVTKRAEMILENAESIECRKYITVKTMLNGNSKLNLAFVAHLFNTYPCLEPLEEGEQEEIILESKYDREAKAYSLWLNSLNVDPYVNNLFEDLKDGLVLLQTIDHIFPEMIEWRKVNKVRENLSRFKQVENTNYIISLGKKVGFSLVGIQGSDITDGSQLLTLGLVWQLMRANITQTLKSISKNGREVSDVDMLNWANNKVKASGNQTQIKSFKDPTIKTGVFLLKLLSTFREGIVNESQVTTGRGNEDAILNARYAISIARKLGATIFLLPEDIVEVNPKMILTFVGSLMSLENDE